MKNLIFIIASLLCLTACQWDLDKFDLDGNVYDCENTCVNGVCDELKNECICDEGWSGRDCDVEVLTFEKSIVLPETYNNDGVVLYYSSPNTIEITKDNGYIICGEKSNPGYEEYRMLLTKISKYGDTVWEKNLIEYGRCFSIITTENGYLVSTGSTLLNIDLNGNLNFEKKYDGVISKILSKQENSFFLVGTKTSNFWIAEININGDIIWQNNFGSEAYDSVYEATLVNNGILILSAVLWNLNRSFDAILYKTDLMGNLLWSKNYGGSSLDVGRVVNTTLDEQYLIAGYSDSYDFDLENNYGNSDAWAFKCDKNGNLLWSKNYGGSGSEYFYSIQLTNDGNYIMAGHTSSSDIDLSFNNGKTDFWLVKTDSSGNIIWERSYGTSGDEVLSDMQVTSDGGFVMVGTKDNKDIYIVKTDANGNL